ncbi:signal transduction histidine kinase [Roseiarcus fermentans]|uniref:histidine kinase n=1 Tax=Roseiarcus fermentans TaxID=1473586 RepID=A0A366F214_9HYPH|nr:PAS domain-containing sensor histidine kinase [Roseiarcus fermentans]RBP08681.1 signal transduction histidine kinase [Roseiarcus fermentans]
MSLRGFSARRFAGPEGRARTIRRARAVAMANVSFLASAGARADDMLRGLEPPPQTSFPASSQAAFAALVVVSAALAAMAVFHIGARRAWARRLGDMEVELAEAAARADRAILIARSEPQVVIAWERPDAEPSIEGDLGIVAEASSPEQVLRFASWLEPGAAARVEEATTRLLRRGEAFSLSAATPRGRHLDIVGRPVSGSAVVRVRDVCGDRLEAIRLREKVAETESVVAAERRALEEAGVLAWGRDAEGRMLWCNAPYARAVEAPDEIAAVDQGADLFDPGVRREAAAALRQSGVWRRRVAAVVGGQRRTFEVAEVGVPQGSAGVAYDVSEAAALRAEMERNEEDYARTIDRLSTGVAIFDKSKRLTFHNAAYSQMWSLEPAFLDTHPTDGEILDRLRTTRRLPEQVDFRDWKAKLMEAYQALEPSEFVWYLPDGRALRVVTSPNPKGGVTYLFDDATQSYALASQVTALTHVQGETLDALKEGVAVFGADGRMKLFNPVFAEVWRIDPARLSDHPHVDAIAGGFRALCRDPAQWDELRGMVVGLHEHRATLAARLERIDDLTFDCAALPLPDGATLLTFLDVTASANVERALTERNEALVAAERLRNDFVNHVSYELRTPLTNIIGFTQLLAAGGVGPLNPKQLEYAGFITNSSHALLAIIDDILDLASIDAGALELRLEPVDVADAMRAAAAGVQDRLDEASIELRMVTTDGVGAFTADGRRVRQALFNLLSNAINYSEPGQTVTLAAMRRMDEIVFKVSDRGRGIPPEMIERVFHRFETFPNGSRHRGPGLGLSIVKALVELHGGRVLIDTAPNEGTTVTCIFPVDPAGATAAIEEAGAVSAMPRMAR